MTRIHTIATASILTLAVASLVWQRWPKADEPTHLITMTERQELELNCGNQKAAALLDLSKAIEDLHKGMDEWTDFSAFRARMDATLTFCFPLDRDHPDNSPQGKLTDPRRLHPTPEQLELMYKALDDGWSRSTIGQPWKGATSL